MSYVLLLLGAGAALRAQTLESLVKTYREAASPAKRAVLRQFALAHAKEQSGALARFALGMEAYAQKDYAGAIENLQGLEQRLPKLRDYIGYYVAAARSQMQDYTAFAADLDRARKLEITSPFATRSYLLEARWYTDTNMPAKAVALLRAQYAQVPQPEGDLALAEALEATRDLAQAAATYQRVYYQYPLSDAAPQATQALDSLRATMGAAYPEPAPQLRLERPWKMMLSRDFVRAREELTELTGQLNAADRDLARVRIGAVDYLRNDCHSAYRYLQSLQLGKGEADAERLFYLSECARRLGDDVDMVRQVEQLNKRYAKSPWRMKAIVSVGLRLVVLNEPEAYEPLFRAGYQDFPNDPEAGTCLWRVAWSGYMRHRQQAAELMRTFLTSYPNHNKNSAALYFLGRLAETEKDYAAARAYYDRLTDLFPNHYYGVLGRERLTQPKVVAATPASKTLEFVAKLALPERKPSDGLPQPTPESKLRLERAQLLRVAGFDDWAESELKFGARNDAQSYPMAMELARTSPPHQGIRFMKAYAGDYLSIPFEAAPRRFWELLFPMPYQSPLVSNARLRGLDPYVVAALIRQESEFNPEAISRAKAYGLTQVLPSTGRSLARVVGLPRFTTKMLFEPVTNLKLGTYYLRTLLDQWGGRWEETLASYNAGKSRVNRWITWANFSEPAEFVESIPFTETRDYVQAVMRNAALYRRLYENRVAAQRAMADDSLVEAAVKPAVARQTEAKAKPTAQGRSKRRVRTAGTRAGVRRPVAVP